MMSDEGRTLWDVHQEGDVPDWLGLVADNRRLFDALQDEWLRPLQTHSGSVVGVNAHLREPREANGNRIPVRLRIDVDALPDMPVAAFRHGQWQPMPLSGVTTTDRAVFWPGALPLFARRDLTVSSREQQVRLLSMGKRVSNVEVPEVDVDCVDRDLPMPPDAPPELGTGLDIPESADRIRGALSMAIWAVPRIGPWLDVLTESLSCCPGRLGDRAVALEASWWRFPPWSKIADATSGNAQERLWLAALTVFGEAERVLPEEATDRIASAAAEGVADEVERAIGSWRRTTHEILRAVRRIDPDDWRKQPVGLAIQLVLLRPEPLAFKTWFDDCVDLAPAVAWSAAALCGLLHGYKRLDTRFRGKDVQREVVAVQALRMSSGDLGVNWPRVSEAPPNWQREAERYILSWAGREVACKHENERGKWHTADLAIENVQRAALALAKQRHWSCVGRQVLLKQGRKPVSGAGAVEVNERALTVHGPDIRMRLAPGDAVEEVVDEQAFRHLIAVEPGHLPAPPLDIGVVRSDEPVQDVPGFTLLTEFVTEDEEAAIITAIDRSEWSDELQRRVQHYGWRYDYGSRQVDSSMRIGPLPEWARNIGQRLVEAGYFRDDPPDQVIVNEYCGKQGISRHIDSPSSFAGVVAMISLLESWEMVFRERGSKTKVVTTLERRSAAVLEGDARYRWTHEIPNRKSEPGPVKPGNKRARRVLRERRVSLTFRKVNTAPTEHPIATASPA